MLRRVVSALAVVWLAASLAFFALRVLPGDAISTQLRESGTSAELIEARRAELGLNEPIWAQYGRFLSGLVRGDLGVSLQDGRRVSEIIGQQLVPTVSLALSALLISAVAGIGLGLLAAHEAPKLRFPFGFLARLLLDVSLSVPLYWTGTLAIYVVTRFSVEGLPVSGLLLPSLVLGLSGAGAVGQVVRAGVRETLRQDFVQTARAKGLREMHVLLRHVLRASLLPVVTVSALQAGFLLGGVVITESLFVRPGIGRVLLNAVLRQDYPLVQGIVVLGAIIYIFVNTLADVLYRIFDPRVQQS